MQVIAARNPVLLSEDAVDLLVTFDKLGEVPFTATKNDSTSYGRDLYTRALAGEFGKIASTVLSRAKESKHRQIERARDVACLADITALGHTWQADARSQQMLASAILLAQAGVYTPSVWRDADNVDVPVTLQQLVALAGTMAAQTQAAYATSWARKVALNMATTVADVESV